MTNLKLSNDSTMNDLFQVPEDIAGVTLTHSRSWICLVTCSNSAHVLLSLKSTPFSFNPNGREIVEMR